MSSRARVAWDSPSREELREAQPRARSGAVAGVSQWRMADGLRLMGRSPTTPGQPNAGPHPLAISHDHDPESAAHLHQNQPRTFTVSGFTSFSVIAAPRGT